MDRKMSKDQYNPDRYDFIYQPNPEDAGLFIDLRIKDLEEKGYHFSIEDYTERRPTTGLYGEKYEARQGIMYSAKISDGKLFSPERSGSQITRNPWGYSDRNYGPSYADINRLMTQDDLREATKTIGSLLKATK